MSFTVLGAKGFVGSALVPALRAQGVEVYAPDRGDTAIFTRNLGHVIYCIGLTADFRERPFATIEAHVSVLNDILQRSTFDSLLYLSSTRVYMKSDTASENTVLRVLAQDPSDIYNLSKLTGESICYNSGRANVRSVRLSNVLGPDTSSSNFIFDIGREALAGCVRLRSHPQSAKDYIAIDDLNDMLPRIAQSGKSQLYNLGSGYNVTHQQWLEQLQLHTKCKIEVASESRAIVFPTINIDRIVQEFGFQPRPVLAYLPEILERLKSEKGSTA